ncbi:M10 family metallopeptidase C-terminal domain-containing protein [Pseudomonas frederiksbergensis]|uniref:M10 family metallopeptidase C-terminal domain-containing protein n=1 Tax=Pseudomonas frederiksbergensis TaxID=104087 RepID=UPI003D257F3B
MPTPLTYSPSTTSSLTGNSAVDSLLSGTYWLGANWTPSGAANLSYSFVKPNTSYFATQYSTQNEYNAMYALTSAQQHAVTSALATWSAVANINFTLTTDNISNVGDLRFGGYRLMDSDTAAWAYLPGNAPNAGDVWIGDATDEVFPDKGSYDYLTFVHEIGHAIGLKHPFSASASNSTILDQSLDDVRYTVMSYNDSYSFQPTGPMTLDILAIQSLYGANNQWQTGNNFYNWAPDQSVFETIWDAGGIDAIDGSNQLSAVRINLNEGQFSQIGKAFLNLTTMTAFNEGLSIAYGAKIENAYGSVFNDTLIGNALDNRLDGMGGADTMIGGAGNDSYYVDNVGDVAVETGTSRSEIDAVNTTINYTLGDNIEWLNMLGSADLNGTGNALDNRILGNTGHNILNGGAGADFMAGGTGNDTYIVDNAGDVVSETSTLVGEIDAVRSSVTWTLGANLEWLFLTGNANINGIGNSQNNVLTGNDGNNQLNGGAGIDTLIGGKGNDDYGLDQSAELALVQENANEGIDTLYVTYSAVTQNNTVNLGLSNLQNVENILLLGGGMFTAVGNDLNNTLSGNADHNILNGMAGADTMIGGTGNDSYYVDNIGDIVIETSTATSEIDAVNSSIDYTLGANIEWLNLLGTANLNGTGNALDNRINGNAGDNILNGGAGADVMTGGAGNDTYIVDNTADTVIESVNEGTDLIQTSASYVLGANIENGELLGSNQIDLTGNNLNNTLTGNASNNVLNGMAGADTMEGGAGNDSYYVDNVGDVVIEVGTSASEIDAVNASINYTLGDNVEWLNLLGATDLNATGNALNNRIIGNAGHNILNGGAGADFMAGGTGNDTYIVDNVGDVVSETSTLAGEIDAVRSSVSWTLGANLEWLTLTGNANINGIGNSLNNALTGNAGDNLLNGGAGADVMSGGAGNDTYIVDNAADTVTESANEGTDLIQTSVSYVLGANIENGQLLGSNQIDLTGNNLNNTLTGNASNNVLNGMAGADTMEGGAGNDSYYVDNVGDVVIEVGTSASEIDAVNASINYTLGDNVEWLNLLGATDLNATGNALNNRIIGNAGHNILNGGAGADFMAGGTGNDTYIVDNVGDVVSETSTLAGEIDAVRSSVSWTLGANLEWLFLTGNANINGIGNSQNNVLTGNDGNNQLNGGAGIDTLIGGKGDDDYGLDQSAELALVQENANEGNDTLYIAYTAPTFNSTIDLGLSNLQNVENILLLGSGTFTAIGNGLNNTLTGNADANILNGMAGADTMIGGAGNDTYYVDNIGDVVIETSTAVSEIDIVNTSVDFTLGANIERLNLLGTANLNGTGNALDNRIIGNAGDNILDGGAGADYMEGGEGSDTYIVDNIGDFIRDSGFLNGSIDTVKSSVTWGLNYDIENLTLTGNANLNGFGNTSNNVLIGNAGNNLLSGGVGADILDGGAGTDTLNGGIGADTFVFSAVNQMGVGANRDVITDFYDFDGDKIDLTQFDSNLPNAGFDRGFTFIGAADFTGAGQVRFFDHVLSGNVSGGTGPDFEIQLLGVNTFSASDLVA